MKRVILVSISLIVATLFTSCSKAYSCQCIKSGNVTHTVGISAKNSSDAKAYCSVYDGSLNGTCSIK